MEGGCLQIEYTGAQASCLLQASASGKTLTSLIGAAGAEAPDAAFGTAGVIDLTATTTDTLVELAAVIDGYTDYSASILFGDDIPTQSVLDSEIQAKGVEGYVLFSLASVLDTTALTTWARAKLFGGFQDSDQNLVEYLINSATEAAESIARRPLKARTVIQDFDGNDRELLILPAYPISSVTSVHVDSDRVFGSTTLLTEGTDYLVYGPEGYLANLSSGWAEGRKTIRVVWNGGLSPVDSRLQDAVIETVAWNMKRFRGGGIGIRSASSPDGVNTAMEIMIPMNAKSVFESYRDGRL